MLVKFNFPPGLFADIIKSYRETYNEVKIFNYDRDLSSIDKVIKATDVGERPQHLCYKRTVGTEVLLRQSDIVGDLSILVGISNSFLCFKRGTKICVSEDSK